MVSFLHFKRRHLKPSSGLHRLCSPTEAVCNCIELPLVFWEKFFRCYHHVRHVRTKFITYAGVYCFSHAHRTFLLLENYSQTRSSTQSAIIALLLPFKDCALSRRSFQISWTFLANGKSNLSSKFNHADVVKGSKSYDFSNCFLSEEIVFIGFWVQIFFRAAIWLLSLFCSLIALKRSL